MILTSSHARNRLAAAKAADFNMRVEVADGRIEWDESIGVSGGFRHTDGGRDLTVPELCALWKLRHEGWLVVDGGRVCPAARPTRTSTNVELRDER